MAIRSCSMVLAITWSPWSMPYIDIQTEAQLLRIY